MIYDIEKIKKGIEPANLLFFPSIDSTNQYVLAHGSQWDLQQPLLVLAEMQTAGQGRRGKNWLSLPGNLTFSWTLESKLPLADLGNVLPILPLHVAFVVRQIIQDFVDSPSIEAQIKWPNDLILQGRKVGGILIQTQPRGLRTLVCIGIGINVNSAIALDHSPTAVAGLPATSMLEATGKTTPLTEFMIELANRLHAAFGTLEAAPNFNAKLFEPHLFGLGHPAMLEQGTNRANGIVRGVATNGDLLLETQGQIQTYNSGSLYF
jgi:BirA family biotin operon repressor/biotin-[acetyl-CoA-carboxylase] ligase